MSNPAAVLFLFLHNNLMRWYVSTSRKPKQHTRRLAKFLGLVCGEYENRGKRSFDGLLERTEKKGFPGILVIYEYHGNPDRIAFYEDGWVKEEIRIKNLQFPEGKESRLPNSLLVAASHDEKLFNNLFSQETSEGVVLIAGKSEISFEYEGKKIGPSFNYQIIEGKESEG